MVDMAATTDKEALQIVPAGLGDVGSMEALIRESAFGLGREEYSDRQIELALESAWGVDTQLVEDGTYYLVMAGERLAACGGWSFRRTLFGNDAEVGRDDSRIDSAEGAAKVRAFFVHPDFARKGLGTMLLRHCEEAMLAAGFRKAELMATLPGRKLYARHGYEAGEPEEYPLGEGLGITFVPMWKALVGV